MESIEDKVRPVSKECEIAIVEGNYHADVVNVSTVNDAEAVKVLLLRQVGQVRER